MRKILIADDHPLIRKGLRQILEENSELNDIKEACTGQEVLDMAENTNFDIVILDIGLPDMNGLMVLKELKKKHPLLPVLIISIQPESQYALSAMRSGASGYLNKAVATEELLMAIEKIFGGGRWITPAQAEKLLDTMENDRTAPPHESLTPREFQVLYLIASGNSVKDIARQLFLSTKTIFCYREHIFKKLKLKNASELVRYSIRHRIVTVE